MMKAFLVGALGYPLLELLYRRRTHYSMAIAGGFSLLLIHKINRYRLSRLEKALISGFGITFIEYICGMIWNKQYKVWDYRRMPCNLHGQICLPYMLLWCGMSAVILTLDKHIKKRQTEY